VAHTDTVRMVEAAELVAIDVFETAQATGRPITITTELVKRHVAELLAHPPECACGRCEAAATASIGHIWRVVTSWQGCIEATRRRAAM
jgi:hypothetical protein